MTTSIEIGQKSILAFGCTTTFAPLLWSISSSAIHLVSVLSYFIARKALRRKSTARLQKKLGTQRFKKISSKVQANQPKLRRLIRRSSVSARFGCHVMMLAYVRLRSAPITPNLRTLKLRRCLKFPSCLLLQLG